MDESWRMRMGTTKQPNNNNNLPHRRSTETLEPEDFDDVFGGPPRSVLSRQFSVEDDFARTMFGDIFTKPSKSDRTLPEFRIPVSRSEEGRRRCEEEFYSDIFGNSRRSRSRSNKSFTNSNSKSKSNSSSILSSEEFSPFRPAVVDVDVDVVSFSSFASNLRPINVSCKWNTSEKMHQMADEQPDFPCNSHSSAKNQGNYETDYIHKFKGCYSGFSKLVSSPEIINLRPNSYTSVKESIEDLQLNSPAFIVSSFNHEDEASTIHEEEDEVMSSYIIEINPSNRERIDESIGIDDAIAWAKQNCQTRTSEKEWNKREADEHKSPAVEEMPGVNKVPEVQESPVLDKRKEWITEEPLEQLEQDISPCKQMELELLDEDIKLWSDGKEQNILLLLSTLHHILWPSSGWIMIPLTNLKESSNVKKAYQKAQLCLHPDKLQQRGATIPQKYVAEKAFPILQNAWAAFISEDVRSTLT